MKIEDIAHRINKESINYQFGKLQALRKEIKSLGKIPTSDIFNYQTINDRWAFHVGGRSELQFNIGIEKEGLRYGFAFSLETSQSLPSLDILYPKILKLNSAIVDNSTFFKDYKMWHWFQTRSQMYDVKPISIEMIKPGMFIFIGKTIPFDSIDYDEILKTFDKLLGVYLEVESNTLTLTNISHTQNSSNENFVFNSTQRKLPTSTSYIAIERQINVEARHTFIQEKLIEKLVEKFGEDAVAVENYINGKKIDVVLKLSDKEYFFYEVKTANTPKACVRQAIGQLLEYSYFNCEKTACKLIVVGEYQIDQATKEYLKFLNDEFKIPISYQSI